MSGRHSDSDSKRCHSRFDSDPNKRYRRDEYGKEDRERVSSSTDVQNEALFAKHNKPNDPIQLPTSLSYFQHNEQGGTGQVGRSSGQRKERGRWKDTKKQFNINEREEKNHGREQRNEKSQAKLDDNTFQRRDGFTGRSRKRASFREKKIVADSGDANVAAVKSGQKEERNSNPQHLDRPEKHFADDKGEARRGRRYGGNDSYKGRDKFNGRQGYRPEKSKHDLYQEVNKDPIPENEDGQIAKLEALLAS
ncbi:hypothetical protein HKD37_11G030120 [Glycine soja]